MEIFYFYADNNPRRKFWLARQKKKTGLCTHSYILSFAAGSKHFYRYG